MTELGEFAMWLAIGVGQVAFWLALSPVIRALADRISGKTRPGGLDQVELRLQALEERNPVTGEVELQQQRLAELEERLDFTERLLVRQRQELGGGPPA